MLAYLAPTIKRLRAVLPRRHTPDPPPDDPLPLAHPDLALPAWVADDPVVQKYRVLLGALPWNEFPERATDRLWPGPAPDPRAPFVAAYLIKLHEQKRYMSDLRAYLIEHPALVWWLGFPRVADPAALHGLAVSQTVPDRRQLSRVLRTLPNAACQFLLDGTVQCIRASLPPELAASFGDIISGDTKHILAWVKENNPKQYVAERWDKHLQPRGDRDCKLGVKDSRNRSPDVDDAASSYPTPSTNPLPASQQVAHSKKGKGKEKYYFWGYRSGVVASKVAGWGEVLLAERTRPAKDSEESHFHPLMEMTAQRLGRRPPFGTWDAGFDAFYVYEYFHEAGGFAAVPIAGNAQHEARSFDADGLPLCRAGLAMPMKFTYQDRTSGLFTQQKGQHVCPLRYPRRSADSCPIGDAHWAKGGCITRLATSIGARIRWQLDRQSEQYKTIYKQRTASERINSQAKELGIERPMLRNGRAITNLNTLIYVLINLRLLQRIRSTMMEMQERAPSPEAIALTA